MNNNSGKDLGNFSMLELFRTEVEVQAAILNEGLLAIEDCAVTKASIEPLMRAAHSIKGAARIVQLDSAVKVAHAMEDCFVAVQEGKISLNRNHIDILLSAVDKITCISQINESEIEKWLSGQYSEIEQLVKNITSILLPSQDSLFEDAITETKEKAPDSISGQKPSDKRGASSSENKIQDKSKSGNILSTPQEIISPKASSQTFEGEKDHVVRITAENLDHLMGLAGESLVESRWIQPFANSLLKFKEHQVRLSNSVERLQESLQSINLNENIQNCLNEVSKKANESRHILSDRINELEHFIRRSTNLSNRLYTEVIASRMRPFADGTQGFPRMVRDLARKLNKKVNFEIVGKATKVDRDLLEKLKAPLNHILRNALDHGIEFPEERIANGKPDEGNVRLEATHRSGMLSITVSDDGRGVDLENIRKKIVEKNLVSSEIALELTESELMEFLFLPNFSTRDTVTELSGRGFGLDIVHSMIQEVRGSVRAVSQLGKGVTYYLQLPITLSVIRSLLVEISGEPYAIPLARIDHTVIIQKKDINILEDNQYITFNNNNVGLVSAHQILKLSEPKEKPEELSVIIFNDRFNRYGVLVDRFLGQWDLVVKPFDPRLGKIPDMAAAAILENGSPVLIIDVDDMIRSVDNLLSGKRLKKVNLSKENAASSVKRILVVDDSITVREVERKILENQGYNVDVAVDGMEGWNVVCSEQYDLVITDVDMPRMDGIELVRNIKRHEKLKSMPVMIVSYKDRKEDRLKGLEAGANYYLTKSSFQDDTLVRAVFDLIGKN